MRHRSHWPATERAARSRLAKLLHDRVLVRGGLVEMSRKCGKPNCTCTRGRPHVSLYLAARVGRERKMIYVPPDWERSVRAWVKAYREAEELIERISQSCLEGFLKDKAKPPEAGTKQ